MLETMHKYNSNPTISRAGVIPYTLKDGRLYFLLGIDRKTRELTDFGGGAKTNESLLDAAIRELSEESCEIFGNNITKFHLEQSPIVRNEAKNAIIFFVKIDPKWLNNAERAFEINQKNLGDFRKHNELIGVKWVEEQYFKNIAFNRKNQCMWRRVQNILRSSTSWNELRFSLMLCPDIKQLMYKALYNLQSHPQTTF